MSDSIIIFLDELQQDKLNIFYNQHAKSFEITDLDIIDFFVSTFKNLKVYKKVYIEDTEEEFTQSGRTSDDYIAYTLNITSENYVSLIKKLKDRIDKEKNLFSKESDDYYTKLEKFSQLIDLSKFIMLYENLTKNSEYCLYTYYIYEEKNIED